MFHFISENLERFNDDTILVSYCKKIITCYLNTKPASKLEKIIIKYHKSTSYLISKIITMDDLIEKLNILSKYHIKFKFNEKVIFYIFNNKSLLSLCRRNKYLSEDEIRKLNYMQNCYDQFLINDSIPADTSYDSNPLYSFFIFLCSKTRNYDSAIKLANIIKNNNLSPDINWILSSIENHKMKKIFASILNTINIKEALSNGLIYDICSYDSYVHKLNKKNQFALVLEYGNIELLEYLYSDSQIINKYYKVVDPNIADELILVKLANLGLLLSKKSFTDILLYEPYDIDDLLKLNKPASKNNYINELIWNVFHYDLDDLLMELIYFGDIKTENIEPYLNFKYCFKKCAAILLAMLQFDEYYPKIFIDADVDYFELAYKMKIWHDYVVDTFQEA